MGCDIHYVLERKKKDGTYEVVDKKLESFENRWYGFFGWLADVRNLSCIDAPIAPRRGLPEGATAAVSQQADWDCHSTSWVAVSELLDCDYGREIVDRRHQPEMRMTLRDFLNYNNYFADLDELKSEGLRDARIIFWFNC